MTTSKPILYLIAFFVAALVVSGYAFHDHQSAYGFAGMILCVVVLASLGVIVSFERVVKVLQVGVGGIPVLCPAYDSLEQEIQAKANKGPRVTPAALQAEIVSAHYFTAADGVTGNKFNAEPRLTVGIDTSPAPLHLLTFCVLVLRNGFTVHGVSSCASPENFNKEIGERIARENAEREIWPLLSFRLRDELARRVLTDADAAADLAGTPRPT